MITDSQLDTLKHALLGSCDLLGTVLERLEIDASIEVVEDRLLDGAMSVECVPKEIFVPLSLPNYIPQISGSDSFLFANHNRQSPIPCRKSEVGAISCRVPGNSEASARTGSYARLAELRKKGTKLLIGVLVFCIFYLHEELGAGVVPSTEGHASQRTHPVSVLDIAKKIVVRSLVGTDDGHAAPRTDDLRSLGIVYIQSLNRLRLSNLTNWIRDSVGYRSVGRNSRKDSVYLNKGGTALKDCCLTGKREFFPDFLAGYQPQIIRVTP